MQVIGTPAVYTNHSSNPFLTGTTVVATSMQLPPSGYDKSRYDKYCSNKHQIKRVNAINMVRMQKWWVCKVVTLDLMPTKKCSTPTELNHWYTVSGWTCGTTKYLSIFVSISITANKLTVVMKTNTILIPGC